MKNVVIPVKEHRAKIEREDERLRLKNTDVITTAKRDEQIAKLTKQIQAIEKQSAADRKNIGKGEALTVAQINAAILENDIATDTATHKIKLQIDELNGTLTKEARAERLLHLQGLDNDFAATYGKQPLTPEETAQRDIDAAAHKKYMAEEHYRHERAMEYPSPGDQLDMLWKIINSISVEARMPPGAVEMLKKIQDIKKKYPGKKNG